MSEIRYGHVMYANALEATWAAFFTRLGWRFQYRPLWHEGQPDFLVFGETEMTVTVVGPLDDLLHLSAKLPRPENGRDDHLLVGKQPFIRRESGCGTRELVIGSFAGWGDDAVLIKPDGYGVCSDTHSYRCRVTGHYDGSFPTMEGPGVEETLQIWAEACEHVRGLIPG